MPLGMSQPEHARDLFAAGQPNQAIQVLRDHLVACPQDAGAWADVAEALLWVGQGTGAVAAARQAWVLTKRPETACLMAVALAQAGRAPEAIRLVQAAVAAAPRSALAWERISRALQLVGAHDSAMDAGWQAYIRSPRDPDLVARIAEQLQRGGRVRDARRLASKVLQDHPVHPLAQRVLVRIELHEGRLDQAAERARTLLLDGKLPAEAISGLWKDLARIEAARGQVDNAFMAATVGNARALLAWSERGDAEPERVLHEARSMLQAPSDTLPESMRAPQMGFLLGFPGPGLDEIRRRLAAHPDVVTVSDPVIEIAMHRVLPGVDGAAVLHRVRDPEVAEALRGAWWEEVQVRVDPEHKRVLDAAPLNLMRVELLARLFPGAPMITVVRDPRDAVLDAFLADFDGTEVGAPLADLATSQELLGLLFALWSRARPRLPRALDLRYEDVDHAPQRHLTPALQCLGLDWDDAMLEPATGADGSTVGAASFGSMRPGRVYSSIGRWRAFAPQLSAILADLGPVVQTLGYPAHASVAAAATNPSIG